MACMLKRSCADMWARGAGVKASADLRENYTPGHKYSHWELKGVCVRLELGPMDMEKKSVMTVRRDTGQKEAVAWADLAKRVPEVLLEMQKAMFDKAKEAVDAALETVRAPLALHALLLLTVHPPEYVRLNTSPYPQGQ